ncbi:hypothetical protein GWO43_23005 [candidate division KSB1 bacterium]|nr:hypothetical protein [candidate division KSB1 bacterium]NIV70775.1 hypothetical protein [Phycisphaerae bacterium]NIR72894.1 hypothetical protein [candidate division KSB1 bacterium]NIT73692.1 hypothetical protein [candidate division KSB1 bacterium]NIU27564.1 hypothetical protein [candidate division KSB1 bacterium]
MRISTVCYAVLLLLVSCASASRKTEYPATTKVKVENQNVSSVTVYVVTASDLLDLGLVQGLTTRVFDLPDGMVAGSTSLQVVADLVGSSQNVISESFSVSPGGIIEVVIEHFPASL